MGIWLEDQSGTGAYLVGNNVNGAGLISKGTGGVSMVSNTGTSGGVQLYEFGSNGISIWVRGNTNSANLWINNEGTGDVIIDCETSHGTASGGSVVIAPVGKLLGFFGASAVGPQVSGGTLAGVIAGLVALGLFSS
jgi:hypothetical protein